MRRDFLMYLVRMYAESAVLVMNETMRVRFQQIAQNIDNADLGYTNREIARLMKEAVLERYDETVGQSAGNKHEQRRSNRLSGKMRAALQQTGVVATGAGAQVRFINRRKLDQEAAHWHRLNFGAGARGEHVARSIEVTTSFYGGSASFDISLDDGPSPAFMTPRGFWYKGSSYNWTWHDKSRRGADAFIPASSSSSAGNGLTDPARRKKRSRVAQDTREWFSTDGIKGYHFFDAGLEAFATHFPSMYRDLFDTWIDPLQAPNSTPPTKAKLDRVKGAELTVRRGPVKAQSKLKASKNPKRPRLGP